MKVRVDSKYCVGHAQCAANGPDVYALDDRGFVMNPPDDMPSELADQVRKGADACPERAITVSD